MKRAQWWNKYLRDLKNTLKLLNNIFIISSVYETALELQVTSALIL